MAEAIQSSAEHTLENQRLGPMQILTILPLLLPSRPPDDG